MSLPLGGIKPCIDFTLPEPTVLPCFQLIIFYLITLSISYTILKNESRISIISSNQLRVILAIIHAIIPQLIVSTNVVANLFFAAMPWFFVAYGATMPLERITLQEAYVTFMAIVIDQERQQRQISAEGKTSDNNSGAKSENRWHGCIKIIRGTIKWIFLFRCIEPFLPENNAYILSLPWFHWKSMTLTMLYGIEGYCFLGIIDIGMGIEEFALGIPLIDLFNSPILASSPRDFWRHIPISRRWNRAVRNLLHHIIFVRSIKEDFTNKDTKLTKTKTENKKEQRISSFFLTKNIMGFLAFFVSGVFHELIITSMFRKMTLENLAFFTLQGIAVWIQLTIRDWATWSKQYPHGLTRVVCVLCHLMFLSVTGRLFLAPYLRYPGSTPKDLYDNYAFHV
ncbi:hypothetical protein INT45_011613 [Circinella minor]|uniref:Wax synthase domain-containing protein n=1 Tax=Circinella minor TaxID=1195481 RepID=A0A8H7VND0_9FUNG|nr:hypothetical protein INT45_011613 [Circinella minor]